MNGISSVDQTLHSPTTYDYDTLDRVVGIRQTDQGGNEVADKYVTIAYAASGAMERIVRYESLDTSQMVAVSRYTYNEFGRLVGLVHFQTSDDPLAEYTWTYEGGGLAEVSTSDSQSNPLAGFGLGLDSILGSTTTDAGVNPLADHVWTFDAAWRSPNHRGRKECNPRLVVR